MSSPTEDRIAAALGARADLVTHADLRPLDIPSPRRRAPRPGVLLLAAAAATVAVGAPFVLTGDDGGDPALPPAGTPTPTPTPSPTPSPSPNKGVDLDSLTEYDEQRADVDGDGRPDQVRLLLDDTPEGVQVGVVEVRLAAGGTITADVPIGYSSQLEPPLDLTGDGRQQVLLPFTQGGDFQRLLVFTWFEDRLVLAEPVGPSGPGLGLDGSGRTDDYYAAEGGLYSWIRGEPVDGSPSRYTAQTVRWTVEGDRLVSTLEDLLCVDVTQEEPPGPC